jgi:anti-sigma factor RsiW
MSISPEMLAAYADDQLDGAERAMVEQALAQDPALAQEVATHRALRARLVAHFAPILEETLPKA